MTEAEWLMSEDPVWMLEYVTRTTKVASDRKLRLFACACCRSLWDVLTEDRSQNAVIVAECFADGEMIEAELHRASDLAHPTLPEVLGYTDASQCARAIVASAQMHSTAVLPAWAALLRDIVGNPFRPVVLPCPWLTPTVASLAQAAYENRCLDGTLDLAVLLVLSDALEEAGCSQETVHEGPLGANWLCTECESRCELKDTYEQGNLRQAYSCPRHGWRSESGVKGTRTIRDPHPLLAHLRGSGPHVRGCHAVDLLLGKE